MSLQSQECEAKRLDERPADSITYHKHEQLAMKLRLASKVLSNALNTGVLPRGSTLRRAVSAFPCGSRRHPRKYIPPGLTAAFLRMGVSMLDSEVLEAVKRYHAMQTPSLRIVDGQIEQENPYA